LVLGKTVSEALKGYDLFACNKIWAHRQLLNVAKGLLGAIIVNDEISKVCCWESYASILIVHGQLKAFRF